MRPKIFNRQYSIFIAGGIHMTDKYLIEPDVGFIKEVIGLGGDTLKNASSVQPVRWPAPFLQTQSLFPERR